jgi:hypothetical protein
MIKTDNSNPRAVQEKQDEVCAMLKDGKYCDSRNIKYTD